MSEVLERRPKVDTKVGIIDSDIHPSLRTPRDLDPFLSARWRKHIAEYGTPGHGPFAGRGTYPRFMPNTARRDAWPPNGGPPGSDLDFMREQHLDANGVAFGILEPLMASNAERNQDLCAALCSAINDWQVEAFTSKDKRLRASILIPFEDPRAAIAEIEKRVKHPDFAQIQLTSRSTEPLGRQKYWPIFEAAEAYNLTLGLHVGGESGHAPSAGGWPSFYIEEHHSLTHTMQCQATSMILEGAFDRFPTLRMLMIEGGFAWGPSLAWRLDNHWKKMSGEVPLVKRPPSEYFRTNLWFSTQPMEEPERPGDLRKTLEWMGWNQIVYASDYPHWDYDDPKTAFPCELSEAERAKIFRGNALGLYKLS